jgi:protein-tyrosine-phosphatase
MEKFSVLFLCTGNSCRSQIAESVLKKIAPLKFNAFSAGSSPDLERYRETKGVNPDAYKLLKDNGYSVEELYAKDWDIYLKMQDKIDFVFTLCDKAKAEIDEACPVFPGQPLQAHWGVFDPSEIKGSQERIERAFRDVFTIIKRRIELFVSLPFESLKGLALQSKINDIGKEN